MQTLSLTVLPTSTSRMHSCKKIMLRRVIARSAASKDARAGTERSFPCQTMVSRTASNVSSSTDFVTRENLLEEAEFLTKSLYRNCLRSVRLIRWGNAFDDKEFERREEEFQNPTAGGVISMAPPPNKEDELRSRAEYYHSYAREYFTQESDSLDNDPLFERDIRRYLYYIRKGEKDRKWLLGDMMFPDPYKSSLDQERIKRFEDMSKKYLGEEEDEEENSTIDDNTNKKSHAKSSSNDGFIEDDDPDWFQKKYPHLR